MNCDVDNFEMIEFGLMFDGCFEIIWSWFFWIIMCIEEGLCLVCWIEVVVVCV